MLLQLENTDKKDINKLLSFAKENHLELTVIDDIDNNNLSKYLLPGKPLSDLELSQMIEKGRKSDYIKMENAHTAIRNIFNKQCAGNSCVFLNFI